MGLGGVNSARNTVFLIIVASLALAFSSFAEHRSELWKALVSSSIVREPTATAKTASTASNYETIGNRNESQTIHQPPNNVTTTNEISTGAVTSTPATELKPSHDPEPSATNSSSSDEDEVKDKEKEKKDEDDEDESSSSSEDVAPKLSQIWHIPPHLSTEKANPNVGGPTELNQTAIDLFETATRSGLTPSQGCSNDTNATEAWCGEQGCWRTFEINSTEVPSETTCKTLWFAGFSISTSSNCYASGYGGYRNDYAVALQSARFNAKDTLQPVLLVGRYDMGDTPLPTVVEWAAAQGAIIVTVDELSFQDLVNNKLVKNVHANHMGPFLRIDVPKIVREHKLMDLPGICDRHVLYTDSDVAFVNKITQSDLDKLKKQIDPSTDAYTLYGHQTKSKGRPINSGIMLFDVYRFEQAWDSFLQFGYAKGPFLSFDQGWLNDYFMSTAERMANRSLLENEWNWKSYWRLAPNEWWQVKIVHFHGPKIGKSLEYMAHCNTSDWVFDTYGKTYASLVKNAICCDKGMTAKFMLDLYYELSPPRSVKCG
ncbi:unnamed protein product [Cylindrotheca closterium]|uniref:Nucleotide-diphospho-sugar transferase domain-containing protein n=1 Tax=Cylindrotheca closterium TaxID=2856 RepID=A0AAD2CEL7_9STRA|nr:unnamed protein product [Cylindrotheca closterium]